MYVAVGNVKCNFVALVNWIIIIINAKCLLTDIQSAARQQIIGYRLNSKTLISPTAFTNLCTRSITTEARVHIHVYFSSHIRQIWTVT